MIPRVAAWSARHPWRVIAATVVLAVACELARRQVPRDLLPELADPRMALVAEWTGHPAPEVSARVTRILTAALDGVPGASTVRGSSMSGMGYVDVVFLPSVDPEAGRRAVLERVGRVQPTLPAGVRLQLGPQASSTGWVFQYALIDPGHGQTPPTLRRLQDEVLRPALASLPGVAEVASVGGALEQIQVDVRSDQLGARGLAFSDVVAALRSALSSSPPADLELADIVLPRPADPDGAAIRLGEVAEVRLSRDMTGAITEFEGTKVTAGGIVVIRQGEDVPRVLAGVKSALEQLRSRLPMGVELVSVYDRSEVVGRIQQTLVRALAEEVAVVAVVLLLFLLHLRTALIPLVTLPVVVLLTLAGMWLLGVPATLMSLAGIGIALGLAVDADVVALEACHRRLEGSDVRSTPEARSALVAAAGTFGPAVLTSLVIAALSFLPVLAFTGETGRLLRPLAVSKTLVIAATALVSLTLSPALRDRLLRGRIVPEFDHPLTRTLVRIYRPFVLVALNRPVLTLLIATVALLSAVPIALRLGREFLPRIDEGDLLFMPTTLPGAPMEELAPQLQRQDRALRQRPEVATVFGKLGRAETATDPAPMSMAEINIRLRPRETWPLAQQARWYSAWAPSALRPALRRVWPEERPPTAAEVTERLDVATRLPGWSSAWTAPARARIDMVTTGIRTPVGVRVVAADSARLGELARAVRGQILRVPGTRSAVLDSLGGEGWLQFRVDPGALQARAVDPALVAETVELVTTGGQVGEVSQGGRKLRVRVSEDLNARGPADQLRAVTVRSSGEASQPIPLALLGRPEQVQVPATVQTEGKELVSDIPIDLDPETALLGYVERARDVLRGAIARGEIVLHRDERIDWIGQYPLVVAGERRLRWIVPLILLSMLGLLYLQFRSLPEVLIVMASVPFALVGSVWTLHWLGYPLSAPVWVGLLSVTGLAMQTGVVMLVYIDDALHRRLAEGRLKSREDVVEAHAEGTVRRLRPKLMTIATMAAALLPLLWAEGAGAEVMRRVAAPMIGGLLTSAFLTLEVLPVLYTLWRVRQLRRAQELGLDAAAVIGGGSPYRRTWAATEGTPLVSTRKSR